MYPPILVEDFVKERVKLHYPQYLEDKNEGQKDPEFIQTLQNEIKGYQIWKTYKLSQPIKYGLNKVNYSAETILQIVHRAI